MIEQATYGSQEGGGYRFLARSPGFLEDWLPEAERICTGFGERPAGISCPSCLFVRPFGKRQVAVVQVADQGRDDAGRPGSLGFHLLVLERSAYLALGGDPFLLAEHFPPPWQARGELSTLTWTAPLPGPRSLPQLRKVLDVDISPTLLGSVQALLDGGRVVFERSFPDPTIIRSLWALLPTRARSELYPATFAFGNAHQFHVLVTPHAGGPDYAQYVSEEQAGDYPEGYYEHNLQVAIESGSQDELDVLLNRRSRVEVFRLALGLLLGIVLLAFGMQLLSPSPEPRRTQSPRSARIELPPVEQCPPLSAGERRELADELHKLGREQGVRSLPSGTTDSDLSQGLKMLDERLGTPDAQRNPGQLEKLGPLQRQIRALLWKHSVPEYNERGLNTVELMERLEKHLGHKESPEGPGRERQGK